MLVSGSYNVIYLKHTWPKYLKLYPSSLKRFWYRPVRNVSHDLYYGIVKDDMFSMSVGVSIIMFAMIDVGKVIIKYHRVFQSLIKRDCKIHTKRGRTGVQAHLSTPFRV